METPNIVDKSKNLIDAVINWAVDDKFKKVSPEIFHPRKQICNNCPYWKPEAFAGLGACGICGCSVGKLYFPHSTCPDKPARWISVQTSYTEGSAS